MIAGSKPPRSSAPLMSSRRWRVQPARRLESRLGAERRAEVGAQHVVPAVMVAGGQRHLFAAGLGARLAPAVVAVAEEEAVVGAEVVIDPGDAGGVGVEPRVAGREEVVALGVGIRVRRHHELHQVGGHRVDAVGGNDVAGKRLRHAVDGVQRVVNRHPRLREVAGAFEIGRRSLAGRHRYAGLQPLERVKEERPVAAVVLRQQHRAADLNPGL